MAEIRTPHSKEIGRSPSKPLIAKFGERPNNIGSAVPFGGSLSDQRRVINARRRIAACRAESKEADRNFSLRFDRQNRVMSQIAQGVPTHYDVDLACYGRLTEMIAKYQSGPSILGRLIPGIRGKYERVLEQAKSERAVVAGRLSNNFINVGDVARAWIEAEPKRKELAKMEKQRKADEKGKESQQEASYRKTMKTINAEQKDDDSDGFRKKLAKQDEDLPVNLNIVFRLGDEYRKVSSISREKLSLSQRNQVTRYEAARASLDQLYGSHRASEVITAYINIVR